MMAKVDVKCPFCAQTASVKKYGPGSAGHQHYRCQACCRSFQVDYEYRACQPGMKGQVVDLAMYNAGIRNPQGLAINPWSGALWLHEHGPRGGDEINIPEKGKNYGWPLATWGVNYSGLKVSEAKGKIVAGAEQPVYYWKDSPAIRGMAFISATFLCRDGINCLSAR
ncbi:PQQ-dependent sugar dehydrogenase [Salmonella enterica]|nr:PQQ-dependent sugar dehydrogenase [Salmonella enterica]